MAVTFEQWAGQCVYHDAMPENEAGIHAGLPGRVYRAGYIIATDYGWLVPLPQGDHEFHTADDEVTYEKPERFLWDEWCNSEING